MQISTPFVFEYSVNYACTFCQFKIVYYILKYLKKSFVKGLSR